MGATPFKTVTELRNAIVSTGHMDPEWAAKMLHPIPKLPTVPDRAAYLIEKAKGKIVLDIGCTGPISKAIRGVAKGYYGVDQVAADGVVAVDIDHRPDQIPVYPDVETVILSEVLEHLANPGYFLMALKQHYNGREVYITVPNAGSYAMREDCEMVNRDHVCWYSYTTLKTLLTRYGYEVKEARWYNGAPYKAEGIIMVVT